MKKERSYHRSLTARPSSSCGVTKYFSQVQGISKNVLRLMLEAGLKSVAATSSRG
jgi:hypothetical protein